MDDTASVITDATDAQVESVDVNLDLIENWNELELREAQVCVHTSVYMYIYICMPPHLCVPPPICDITLCLIDR